MHHIRRARHEGKLRVRANVLLERRRERHPQLALQTVQAASRLERGCQQEHPVHLVLVLRGRGVERRDVGAKRRAYDAHAGFVGGRRRHRIRQGRQRRRHREVPGTRACSPCSCGDVPAAPGEVGRHQLDAHCSEGVAQVHACERVLGGAHQVVAKDVRVGLGVALVPLLLLLLLLLLLRLFRFRSRSGGIHRDLLGKCALPRGRVAEFPPLGAREVAGFPVGDPVVGRSRRPRVLGVAVAASCLRCTRRRAQQNPAERVGVVPERCGGGGDPSSDCPL
mmetsp:Transcript_33714/g.82721  ORF Transcript_33714/g.82721 Transcript_33714/m.82721 type:complete len:279 (-) Transcript_33714:398-1234(-)